MASLVLTRFLRSQVWGITNRDPVTFAAVLGVLITIGLLACFLPAHRATQVDPLIALRYE
jgi:putative ABC transport system permease protein